MRLAKIFKLLQLLQQNNLQDLLGESHKRLNVIVATVLLLKKKDKSYFFKSVSLYFHFHVWRICILQNMQRKWFWLVDSANVNQSKKWAADVS